jgi:ornithine carbamoyltransferase
MSASITTQRDFLRIADLSPQELHDVLSLAAEMKADPTFGRGVFSGDAIACYFARPSTRTHVSFEAAAARLGLVPIMLLPDELQSTGGEVISDTAKMLSACTVAIVVRTSGQHEVEAIAGSATVPVVNAVTDLHHPCQALADLLTMKERFGALPGLKLAYIGHGNNVAHSLMEGAARVGIDIVLATPAGHRPDPEILLEAEVTAREHGCAVALTDDPREAVRGADVVYTDATVPSSLIDGDLLSEASAGAIVMRWPPALLGSPQSVVFEQAANRMPTEQAVLFDLIGQQLN